MFKIGILNVQRCKNNVKYHYDNIIIIMIYKPEYIIGICLFVLFFPLIHLFLIMSVFKVSEYINDKVKIKNIKE
jgi:hypothetical protein